MALFIDDQNHEWTEEELQLAEIPANVIFQTFNLHNTKLKRLPKNLRIESHLDLGGTAVEILESGLQVEGELNITNSSITVLPSDLYASHLCLTNSNLHSIGQNIKCYRLSTDSTSALTSLVECHLVQCYSNHDLNPVVLDFSNIQTENIVLTTTGNFVIRNARAAKIQVSLELISAVEPGSGLESKSRFLNLDLQDSEFTYMFIGKTTTRYLVTTSCNIQLRNVVGKKLFVITNTNVDLELSISAKIDDVVIDDKCYDPKSPDIRILSLYLDGNLRMTNDPLDGAYVLPEIGLIYGDLTIPKGMKVPENLNCLGSINYEDLHRR